MESRRVHKMAEKWSVCKTKKREVQKERNQRVLKTVLQENIIVKVERNCLFVKETRKVCFLISVKTFVSYSLLIRRKY